VGASLIAGKAGVVKQGQNRKNVRDSGDAFLDGAEESALWPVLERNGRLVYRGKKGGGGSEKRGVCPRSIVLCGKKQRNTFQNKQTLNNQKEVL